MIRDYFLLIATINDIIRLSTENGFDLAQLSVNIPIMANCTQGYSSDNILRLPMPVGPFNEPYGEDCFRNDLALEVCCSIFLVIVLFLALLYGHELATRSKKMSRAIYFVYFVSFIQLALIAAFLFCMIYKPEVCFILWAIICFTIWFHTAAILHVGFQSIFKILQDLVHKSLLQVIGGRKVLVLVGIAFWFGSICNLIGAVGTAVSVSKGDIERAVIFWQVHCAAFTFAYSVLISFIAISLGNLSKAFSSFSHQ